MRGPSSPRAARAELFFTVGLSDALAHRGIGLHIFHFVIIHHAESALAEGFGHRERHLRLRFDDFRLHLLHAGLHFLFHGDGRGATDFRLRLRDALVRLRLRFLEFGAHVFADVYVRDIN